VFAAERRLADLAGIATLEQTRLPGGKNEAYDWFGSALAVDDASGAIIVGAWGEAPEGDDAGGLPGPDNAGAIAVFTGVGAGKVASGTQYSQGSETAIVARN
jgi:hypothetical protein